MELEKGKETPGKKGDNADDIEKNQIEVTEHDEDLSSRNQLPIFGISASPLLSIWGGAAELAEENRPLLNSPANYNEVTYSAAEGSLESDSGEEEEEEEEEEKEEEKEPRLPTTLFDRIAFAFILGLLVCSLTLEQLQNLVLWDFKIWRWCVLALVIWSSRISAFLLYPVFIFPNPNRFLPSRKSMFYFYGMRGSITTFSSLITLFIAWNLLFGSKKTTSIFNYVTKGLAYSLILGFMGMLRSFLFLVQAISFQPKRFLEPIRESIFHQYIIQTLSGPPLRDQNQQFQRERIGILDANQKCVIDVQKFKKIKRQNISPWGIKKKMDLIRSTKLSIFSSQRHYKEIKSELEAEHAALEIINNVANRGCGYLSKEDLHGFLIPEDVRLLLTKFEGAAETGKIQESEFKEWVVKVYNERKALSHFIKQSKSATEEFDWLFKGIALVVSLVLWLNVIEILSTKALTVMMSQLVLAAFIFGTTAKNIFESVTFLYVMHPFDVGDRCVVDGVEMVVEEIHILTTGFVRFDNEKVFYPNPVLATKTIKNLYRSTRYMKDSVEFVIDLSTSIESPIEALNSKIEDYLNSNSKLWRKNHKVVVKEIEDAKKIRMVIEVTHTINFREYGEKSRRRSKLVLQLKQIFEELGISKYHVLPQP